MHSVMFHEIDLQIEITGHITGVNALTPVINFKKKILLYFCHENGFKLHNFKTIIFFIF